MLRWYYIRFILEIYVRFKNHLTKISFPHKTNETNDKFYRKVAFKMYTEMVNFRPQS